MERISNWVLTNNGLGLYHIKEEDFELVKSFLDERRARLDRIEFFYPYTDEELRSVLRGGWFYALRDGDKIVATFALDTDKEYARRLAERVAQCTRGRIAPRYAYETSGLMADEAYRGKGLASELMRVVLAKASEIGDWVCGVVQLENVASIRVFLRHGFVLAGIYAMGGDYDFGYFVRPSDGAFLSWDESEKRTVRVRDTEGHGQALAAGFVGTHLGSDCIEYAKLINV